MLLQKGYSDSFLAPKPSQTHTAYGHADTHRSIYTHRHTLMHRHTITSIIEKKTYVKMKREKDVMKRGRGK